MAKFLYKALTVAKNSPFRIRIAAYDLLSRQMTSFPETKPLPLAPPLSSSYDNPLIAPKNILFISNSFNSMCQRAFVELSKRGHNIVEVVTNPAAQDMEDAIKRHPAVDLVVCPFLTKYIPASVYNNSRGIPVLVVHPGIPGDRGASSLDWALLNKEPEWGVSVVQAHEEMDAGDIWGTSIFPMNRKKINKSSLYHCEIADAAVSSLLTAIENFDKGIQPTPLDYNHPEVKGELRRNMKRADRKVDWYDSAANIHNIVRMSDTQPGAITKFPDIPDHDFLIFGAHLENKIRCLHKSVRPGEILGYRDGAILVQCGDGLPIWISHMKHGFGKANIKLPATSILPPAESCLPLEPHDLWLPFGEYPDTFQEIWVWRNKDEAYIHFNFYNGAMSSEQAVRLKNVIKRIDEDSSITTVVLMGGYDYFGNGIHLNVIEASVNPAVESWRNINGIDDVIKAIFSMENKFTISAMQGNAGAGGFMMALAADKVISHPSTVFNPSYKGMALYGSEYWTKFLPLRVGAEKAIEITDNTEPMSSVTAYHLGLIDNLAGENAESFITALPDTIGVLKTNATDIIAAKRQRTSDWYQSTEEYRYNELRLMKECFKSDEYNNKRSEFVHH